MRGRRLLWRLYFSYILVTAITLLAALLFTSWSLREFYYRQVTRGLEARARLVEDQLTEVLERSPVDLDPLCERLGEKSNTRITVVLADGLVACDSERDPEFMDNHLNRPEIGQALAKGMGKRTRYSSTLKKEMVYLALRLEGEDGPRGVVRTSMPVESLGMALKRMHLQFILAGLVIAVAAALASLVMSKKISKPLEEMKKGAMRFAAGDLGPRLAAPDSEELSGLAEAMNLMAEQLGERIATITWQRNQQEAILTSMSEGVIAVDAKGRVISMNKAVTDLFGAAAGDYQGRDFREVVPSPAFQELVSRALDEMTEVEAEIELTGGEKRTIQAAGAVMKETEGANIGAVIVLNDITRIRKLEQLRRDFVANVSHELRTPITSIRGFVETLRDGAMQVPEDAERFLSIMSRQVDQLGAIVEDLLLLSRIERYGERTGVTLSMNPLRDVLEAAIEACSVKAAKKDIGFGLACGENLKACINPPMLTQAVVNLVDNAISYSPEGSSVRVETVEAGDEILIKVIDRGRGIEREHLDRVFERFYRVDKARSRKMGGTGLGLAIVKHISHSHGGSVTVESEPGQGSTFTIRLPRGG